MPTVNRINLSWLLNFKWMIWMWNKSDCRCLFSLWWLNQTFYSQSNVSIMCWKYSNGKLKFTILMGKSVKEKTHFCRKIQNYQKLKYHLCRMALFILCIQRIITYKYINNIKQHFNAVTTWGGATFKNLIHSIFVNKTNKTSYSRSW